MSIFTGNTYDTFITDERVKSALILRKGDGGREFSIFNKTDIINHFINVDRKECFDDVLSKMCGSKAVDPGYIEDSFKKVFDDDSDFDILAIAEVNAGNKHKLHNDDDPLKFTSFLITQLGECKSYRNTVVLNLICSNGILGSSLLLAAYLYMIKGSNYDHEGLLELAGGFKNIPGLCAYGKFGFEPNIIKQGDCSTDASLAMTVDIDKVFPTYDDILNVFAEFPSKDGKPVPSFEITKHPLCNEYNPKKNNPNKNIIPKRYLTDNEFDRLDQYDHVIHPLYVTQRDLAGESQSIHLMDSKRRVSNSKIDKLKQAYKSQIQDEYDKVNQNKRSHTDSIQEGEEEEEGNKRKRGGRKNKSISNVRRLNKFAATTLGKKRVRKIKKRRTRRAH